MSIVPKAVSRELYKKLLRSAGSLQKQFDAREEKGMKGIDNLLLRVAMRPESVMIASTPVVAEIDSASCLVDKVRSRFREPGPTTTSDINHAFSCLKFSTEVCKLLDQCNQPEKRGSATLNIGQIVWHQGQLCAIYGFTSEFKQCQSNNSNLKYQSSGPYYHVVSTDGKFRYVNEFDVEIAKGKVQKYLEKLRGISSEGSFFIDGLLFDSFTSDRLIANLDLWKRYPDTDSRTTAVGIATLPLNLDRDQYCKTELKNKKVIDQQPKILASFLSYFKLTNSYQHRSG